MSISSTRKVSSSSSTSSRVEKRYSTTNNYSQYIENIDILFFKIFKIRNIFISNISKNCNIHFCIFIIRLKKFYSTPQSDMIPLFYLFVKTEVWKNTIVVLWKVKWQINNMSKDIFVKMKRQIKYRFLKKKRKMSL